MPNKHFCQGPTCHEKPTTDRFLKSRGVIRGRYANLTMNHEATWYKRSRYFCSTNCESLWLDEHMEHIEQGRPIEFIRHRRETGGFAKVETGNVYGPSHSIQRVDNRTEIE